MQFGFTNFGPAKSVFEKLLSLRKIPAIVGKQKLQ
jgi:hypothetical protein